MVVISHVLHIIIQYTSMTRAHDGHGRLAS